MKKRLTNEQILEEFFDQYFRSPSREEFVKCGGNLRHAIDDYGGYNQFLIKNNYDPYHGRTKTYEVFDEKGNSLFVGTSKDVAEELEISEHNVREACFKGNRIKWKYTIKVKEFKGHL